MSDPDPEGAAASRDEPQAAQSAEAQPPAEESPGPPSEEAIEAIDRQGLDAASRVEIPPFVLAPAAAAPDASGQLRELVDEVAEDMLSVRQRLKAIEEGQAGLLSRLDELSRKVQEASCATAVEVDKLRRTIAGEQKALLARSAFDAVVSALDSLRQISGGLNTKHDKKVRQQLAAAEAILATTVQRLGFQEFQAKVGERFDPSRMESMGYAAGQPGVVIRRHRPGYLGNGVVVRPAGVIIAAPGEASGGQNPQEGTHER